MKSFGLHIAIGCATLVTAVQSAGAGNWSAAAGEMAAQAGANRAEIDRALADVAAAHRSGMEFLVANMPARDVAELSAEYLLENVRLAYQAYHAAPWRDQVPEDVFLNDVLPYASVNERRDRWRRDFLERFGPLIKGIESPGEAAARLNNEIFKIVNVRYSTDRPKADQSPYESIECGKASCTGLSILLIDACRALAIPARFAGTPLWSDKSGNHSWVEVWDGGWHFTGAAEPSGDELDKAWFVQRTSTCQRDHPRHAIFATSWRKTPLTFPLVWNHSIDYVHAVNVTDRYTVKYQPLPSGMADFRFRVMDRDSQRRRAVRLCVLDNSGKEVFSGKTNDERFDLNDHLTAPLHVGATYTVVTHDGGNTTKQSVVAARDGQLFTIWTTEAPVAADLPHQSDALARLRTYLQVDRGHRTKWETESSFTASLSRADADEAARLLWHDHAERIRVERASEMKAKCIRIGDAKLSFDYQVFGERPAGGRSLYISLHGGGGAPASLNDGAWERHKTLYEVEEGLYLAPRSPTNTWNMWHLPQVDQLLDRLIENLLVFEQVNPNRVYLLGYSAGGDGVYQLAPRMADRWAAAAMMAGHPNDASPRNLRNLPFTLHMGALDSAYNRAEVAAQWKQRLAELHQADPGGYDHWVEIHAGKGHWMELEDAAAIPWMSQRERNPIPQKIVWRQHTIFRNRLYWLAADPQEAEPQDEVVVSFDGQHFEIERCDTPEITIRINDRMLDLDRPIKVTSGDEVCFAGNVSRTIDTLAKTLSEFGDPQLVFPAEVQISLPDRDPQQ